MKILIVLALMFAANPYLMAQKYEFPSEKLIEQFVEIYKKTDKKANFFERMASAGGNFFRSDNNLLCETILDFQRNYHIPTDSSANIVFDTIVRSFSQNHMWEDYPGKYETFRPFFELYNGLMCPCVTGKIKQSPRNILDQDDTNQCVTVVVSDTGYINKARRLIGHISASEVQELSLLSGIYIYQNCAAMYRYFSESIRYETVNVFLADLKNQLFQLDQTVVNMYRQNSSSLAKVFPAHKKYETDLKLAVGTLDIKQVINFRDKKVDNEGNLVVTNTYYSLKGDKSQLHGQIIFTLKDDFFTAPMLSFRYVPAAKMQDRKKYIKLIEEENIPPPPPPEMLELENIKIDTIKSQQ